MSELDTALTGDDKNTLHAAAQGVVSLMAAADPGLISSTKAGMAGGKALTTATGPIGHLLAANTQGIKFKGTFAEVADQVLPKLTASVDILKAKAPQEVDNFRHAITTVVQSAAGDGSPKPAVADIARKIDEALDA
jgi:hypothetical protein